MSCGDGFLTASTPPASLIVTLGFTLFHAGAADMPDEFFALYDEWAEGDPDQDGSLALAS